MYINSTVIVDNKNLEVAWREEMKVYTIRLDYHLYLSLKHEELEHLYTEILGAMMHRRFAESEPAVDLTKQD